MPTPYQLSEVCIASVSIILNITVITVIVRRKQLHTPNNIMIGHLATADVIVCLLVVPSAIISSMNTKLGFDSCLVLNSVIIMFTNVPIIILMCVTMIRFIAVRFPLTYKYSLTTRRVMYIGVAAWIFGILLGLIPFAWNKGADKYESKCHYRAVMSYTFSVYFKSICMFLIPMLTMALVYTYIGCNLKKMMGHSKQEAHSIELFGIIILVYFLLKFPLRVLSFLPYYQIDPPWGEDTNESLVHVAILMSRSNSIVNPFIYAFGNRKIVEAMPNMENISNKLDSWGITQNRKRPETSVGISPETSVVITPSSIPIKEKMSNSVTSSSTPPTSDLFVHQDQSTAIRDNPTPAPVSPISPVRSTHSRESDHLLEKRPASPWRSLQEKLVLTESPGEAGSDGVSRRTWF